MSAITYTSAAGTAERDIIDTACFLNEHGVRPSVQRMAVYQYLKDNHVHPTADALYLALAPAIPTLSKTTVYNTLKLLEKKRLVKSIAIENDELRYDADTSDHWHFKCTKCGKVYDVFSENAEKISAAVLNAVPEHFACEKIQMNIWGKCADCASV